MSEPEEGRLAPDSRALLAVEHAYPSPPADGKRRVAARLDAMLLGPGPRGGSGGGGGLDEPAPAPTRPVAAPTARAARAITTFVGGAVTGGVLVLALREPRVVVVVRPTPVTTATESMAGAPSAFAPQATRPLTAPEPSASVAPAESISTARPVDSLAAERALLNPARTALGRSDGASALDAVNKHAVRFPAGKLAEEREAIAVQALVVLHRTDEARARAARFQQRYPGSVLAPSVAAALESMP